MSRDGFCQKAIYIYIYSRTVGGRSPGSFDSLVSMLASNVPDSVVVGVGEVFSESLDFLDRGFKRIKKKKKKC